MKKELNLEEQIALFKKQGQVFSNDGTSDFHGFFDWFCSDKALEKKGKDLMNRVIKFLAINPKIDPKTHYVFFKNNCPMNGPLYDSFSICRSEDGNVEHWVTPKSGHTGKAEWFSRETGFNDPVKEAATFTELLKP